MLRLVLLAFYLAFLYNSGPTKIGGGWDPNGLAAQPGAPASPGPAGGGLDPDGLTTQTPPGATGEGGGNLDPDG